MKFLCLAYGNEKDWNVLTKKEQDEMLAQDEVVRKRGALKAEVQTKTTTVRAWDGKPITTDCTFADSKIPLAGFSIIEAADLDEVIRLVAGTPCARAKGAIEIRPIMAINDFELIRLTGRVASHLPASGCAPVSAYLSARFVRPAATGCCPCAGENESWRRGSYADGNGTG